MMLEDALEFIAILLLCGIIALACMFIILAMCAVASDADDQEEEWIENDKKGKADQ